jgi:hypothetical protein
MRKFFILAGLLIGFSAQAQYRDLYQVISTLTLDTVTNTATNTLTSLKTSPTNATSTTIWVTVTKISGTVGGTMTLQGSLDGTNFKAINTSDTQTALATVTATDANNTYHWRLAGCPFLFYRVSWTGTGTMAASFSAKILAR